METEVIVLSAQSSTVLCQWPVLRAPIFHRSLSVTWEPNGLSPGRVRCADACADPTSPFTLSWPFPGTLACLWVPTLTYKHTQHLRRGTSPLPRQEPSLSWSDPMLCAQQLGPAVRGLPGRARHATSGPGLPLAAAARPERSP